MSILNRKQYYYHDDTFYARGNAAYYAFNAQYGNHAIAIVGWGDNYAKTNFASTPPGNGAFICRNSWGTSWGANGYYYISYYDTSLGYSENAVFTDLEVNTNYNKIYQYDPFGYTSWIGMQNVIYGANVFTTGNNTEALAAVSFYTTEKNVGYEIYVIPQWSSINSFSNLGTVRTKRRMTEAGYHTVQLDSSISMEIA